MIAAYVVWGNAEHHYTETAFSILTLLPDPDVARVCVVTDHPEFLACLKGRIDFIRITQETIREWKGQRDFLFRMKIRGVQHVLEKYPGEDMLYLDSDTFRGRPLAPVRAHLAAGGVCMSESSGLLCKMIDRGNRTVYAQAKGRTFSGCTVDESTKRMNAGTVGLPAEHAAGIAANVLAVSDELHALTGYAGCEELAFSFALALHGPVLDAGGVLGHYWGNKRAWDAMLDRFFAAQLLRGATPEEMAEAAGRVDFAAIPVYIHKPRRHRQLERLANRFWPLNRARHYPEKLKEWL